MAIATASFSSKSISMASVIQIVMPEKACHSNGEKPAVMMMLSPEGREGRWWISRLPLESISEKYNVAFVLVPALQGCYVNMRFGYRFFDLLSKDVPQLISTYFPSLDLARRYVAGYSIGGMGALKLALSFPGDYLGCASFSGKLDSERLFRNPEKNGYFTEKRMINLWGTPEEIKGSENDLVFLAECAKTKGDGLPRVFLTAFRDDVNYTSTKQYYDRINPLFPCVMKETQSPDISQDDLESFLQWVL